MYLTTSYSTDLHCEGLFWTFEEAKTPRKWLRVHVLQEWHELYRTEAVDDLQRFYDFYANEILDGWEEQTPRVRLTLLGYECSQTLTAEEHPEEQWPPASQWAGLRDLLYFDKKTEICGRPFVKLYMSCDESDDMDVVVQIGNVTSSGGFFESLNWSTMPEPAQSPECQCCEASGTRTSFRFILTEDDSRLLLERLPLYIPIWPVDAVFEAGEGLMLRVSGHDMALPEVEMLRLTEPVDENRGNLSVYTGGEYRSYLSLPIIRP
ncbi:hypothetical protein N7532_003579 [Penicillium argentinense]|uniref:Xaa-Pro dipeptidyl-peptidase C-terminal domain-containing protein n=1 Tax=Penicillium argentinense TaxID=1131581 RepID=A0A9W9KE10_9EURO|nr:uncharacterized protein N7532_003579 [Penicillium argentinense]KAJ5103050.1 hypothetical protein N7532_003579 [Penicillium argentinense]